MRTPEDHERIWLEPDGCADPSSGRMWCQDKVWPDGDCECEPTEYVRSDVVAAAIAEAKAEGRAEAFEEAAKEAAYYAKHSATARSIENAIRALSKQAQKGEGL